MPRFEKNWLVHLMKRQEEDEDQGH